ncbi:MAG TPA: hypothetical protein VHE83_16630 [Mycobacteriales bacterium]|nr:hypothetical protein [Mycobacteriales bacterium]
MRRTAVRAAAILLGIYAGATVGPAAHATTEFGPNDPAWQAYYAAPHDASTWPAFCAGGHGRVAVAADGVPACGPTGGTAIDIPGDVATPGFQCVELSDRFLYVTHHWKDLVAHGAQVAARYSIRYGVRLITSGTPGIAPHKGDVMSFSNQTYTGNATRDANHTDTGHTGVVVASTVDASSGIGTFQLLSENIGNPRSGDLTTFTVQAWKIPTVFGWHFSEWIQSGSATSTQPTTGPTSAAPSWSIRSSSATGTLSAVIMTPSHGWAVGSTQAQGLPSARTLVDRYSSTSRQWTQQTSPDIGSGPNALTAVAGSDLDAWAVGQYEPAGGSGGSHALALHWNGSRWLNRSPPFPVDARLSGVAERSPHDVWAVGERTVGGWELPWAVHWNGSRWNAARTPVPASSTDGLPPSAMLTGVSAVPHTSIVIAVGEQGGRGRGSGQPFALRWNGTAWHAMGVPMIRNGSGELAAVAASPDGVVWAVGSYETSAQYPLVLRLAGQYWAQERIPAIPNGYLSALATTVTGNIWAAGAYQPPNATWTRPLVLYGSGSHWANTHATAAPIGSGTCPGFTDGYQGLTGIAIATHGFDTWAVGYHDRICAPARLQLIERHG